MSDNVVQLHFSPSLRDIPGQLRQLADAIERGDHGKVTTMFAVVPEPGSYPAVFAWGDIDGHNDPIVQLELAKAMLVQNIVSRG